MQQVHLHFLDIMALYLPLLASGQGQGQKNKTSIQWMDLPFYAMQWESILSLCQYKYH
jgi:hypothetical protein